ncbi:MAG: carbon-nitrogen hydrolase family protein [Spirochaetales bacterium]|nr:carbon-nitrogen hydrolase family protein [Spirochaetales bacterium]
MNTKKWLYNGIYLAITLVAFSFSLFKFDNPVWIAAWIAPVFLIRFMRNSKWIFAVITGFVTLQLSIFIGLMPFMSMVDETAIEMDFLTVLIMQIQSGLLLLAPLYLVPFILDKALYKKLPKFLATLIFPSAVVAVEMISSFWFGTGSTFGDTQFTLPPLVMFVSIFGVFGLSFLVAWSASMINFLWQEKWNIKNLGYSGLVFISIITAILIYSGTVIAFPQKADKNVPIAGITLDNNFYKIMAESGLSFNEIVDLDSDEYTLRMSSPQSYLHEMREKTLEAVRAGAKIIVWQEYALTLESSAADAYLLEMKNIADEHEIYLLVSYARILNKKERKKQAEKNMSVLFTPDGKKAWEYAKAFPGPGFEDVIVEAGPRNIPYIDTPYGRIGQVICVDMCLPHYLRQAAVKNIDLLFVPSFDAPMFTPLITYTSAYRALENGFTMVRIAGFTGDSAVIDPYYRYWAGQNFIEHGSRNFYTNVPVVSHDSFYAAIGFIFPYIIVLLLLSLIVLAIIRTEKKE